MSRRGVAAVCAGAFAAGALLSAGTGTTFARWSDFRAFHSDVRAGVWAPDPPAACGDVSNYAGVVYGTAGDDDLTGGNHPQIIMGLGGNDTIHAGNSGDCLVGGDGNDHLYGENAKDILIGGPGDDVLDGGNAPDSIDGGAGEGDLCIGGTGSDTYTDCEEET